ncbi:hypothetical protein COK52_06815 [Bacillus thuringiensis]|nr:hypothetical protein COK52_06815 [Bacillus thuringiensis]
MIKINRSIALLDDIKSKHYEYFNTKKPKDYKDLTYRRLLRYYAHYSINPNHKAFFNHLYKKRKILLTGSAEELHNEIAEISTKFIHILPEIKNKKSILHKSINKVFDYSSFTNRTKTVWGAYSLVTKLGIKVCPYCNRQYTTTYYTNSGENKGKTRATLDHFYDKGTHPYLALSLFNLIPSCSVCNSSFKGKKQFNINDNLHPYDNGFGSNIHFQLDYDKTELQYEDLISSTNKFRISLNLKKESNQDLVKKADNNAGVFKIEDIYNEHKDIVVELLQKKIVYTNDYIDSIYAAHSNIFYSKDDVYKMIIGNYIVEDDFEKRVLAKFTKDIAKEIGF